ncbi:hypothetical protein RN001_016010 [Aquatica leii]|uniref:Uncharacterized protein n=1 Tax=Aquatica leii TaxID=1421715 RepID=A0AAN7NYT7_9COLE|nr:hypothetical protein RN001_016010 [Aquatica leii]
MEVVPEFLQTTTNLLTKAFQTSLANASTSAHAEASGSSIAMHLRAPWFSINLDFLPSLVTEVSMQSDTELQHQTSATKGNICNDANTSTFEDLSQEPFDVNEKENVDIQPSISKEIVTIIHQISLVPSAAAKRGTSRQRIAEKSEILTLSPYKNALIEDKATKAKPAVVKMQQLKGKKTNDPTKKTKSTVTPKTAISQTSKSSTSVTEKISCLISLEDSD